MMEKTIFKKKYLGELTLKNGEHVKFLYPVNKNVFHTTLTESEQLYKTIQKHKDTNTKYWWVLIDNLNLIQFQVVYANIKKYGDNYWKKLWENRDKK